MKIENIPHKKNINIKEFKIIPEENNKKNTINFLLNKKTVREFKNDDNNNYNNNKIQKYYNNNNNNNLDNNLFDRLKRNNNGFNLYNQYYPNRIGIPNNNFIYRENYYNNINQFINENPSLTYRQTRYDNYIFNTDEFYEFANRISSRQIESNRYENIKYNIFNQIHPK